MSTDAAGPQIPKPWYKSVWALLVGVAGVIALLAGAITNVEKLVSLIWPKPQPVGVAISISGNSEAILSRNVRYADFSIIVEIQKNFTAAASGCKVTITWPTQDTGGRAVSSAFSMPANKERHAITVRFRAFNELEGNTGHAQLECNNDVSSSTIAFEFPEVRT